MRYHVGAEPGEAVIGYDPDDLGAREEALNFAKRLMDKLNEDPTVRVEFLTGRGKYRVLAYKYDSVGERAAAGLVSTFSKGEL
jgi:hypothetical protein